jgi:hypothetical protein
MLKVPVSTILNIPIVQFFNLFFNLAVAVQHRDGVGLCGSHIWAIDSFKSLSAEAKL